MLENIVKNLKYAGIIGLTALTLGCGKKPSVQCKIDSDCKTNQACVEYVCKDKQVPPENKTIPPVNQDPVSNAGPDQPANFDKNCFDSTTYDNNGLCPSGYNIENNIHPSNQVTLDGSLSSDPEGKALQYLW